MDRPTVEAGSEFAFEGLWWEPSDTAEPRQAHGRLSYEPSSGALLSVIDLHPGLDGLTHPFSNMPVLHGQTLKGRPCTLLDCILTNADSHLPSGHSEEKWQSNQFVYGAHVTDVDDIRFSRIEVQLRGLREWLWAPWNGPETVSQDQPASRLDRMRAWFAQRRPKRNKPAVSGTPDHRSFEIPLSDGTLTFFLGRTQRTTPFKRLIEVTASAHFEFEQPTVLTEFKKRYYGPLHDLIILATREETRAKSMTVLIPEKTPKWWGDKEPIEGLRRIEIVERTQLQPLTPRSRPYGNVLLPFSAWGVEASEKLRRWFDLRKELGGIGDLLFATVNVRYMYLENQILNLVSVAEAYHRALHDEPRVDQPKHEEAVKAMLEVLDDNSLREIYRQPLRYAYQQTLRTRMRWLFGRAATVLHEIEQWRRLASRLVETRNYLTHWSGWTTDVLEDRDRWIGATRLKIIIEVNLMLDLGMQKDAIEYAVRQSYREHPALS